MLNITSWRLLFVDDDDDLCRQIKEFLEGESITEDGYAVPFQVETLTSFSEALDVLQAHLFDLLILDVRLGSYGGEREDEAGVTTLQAVRERRFIPVVFYTGLPNAVRDLETPLIRVVEKTEMPRLLEAVKSIFATRLPVVNRAMIRHLETVQRDYMWDFVATHWDKFGNTPDRIGLAYLLARRLAMSLSGPGMQQLLQDLGNYIAPATDRDKVPPMRYYVMPPVETTPLTGDLFYGQIEEKSGYWVLLTPSCDLVTGRVKAEWTLLAHCELLTEQVEYKRWHDSLPNPSNTLNTSLLALLQNNRKEGQSERFYFLPSAIDLPDLVVDFQQVVSLLQKELAELSRLASLDSPFAESLLTRFTRYFGRLGTPDLDADMILSKLNPGELLNSN